MNIWQKIQLILPSIRARKIIFLILILFVLLFLIFFNLKHTKKDELDFETNEAMEKDLQELMEIKKNDTDGDGLYDWEERLYGTNPKIRDTDNDGVSDYKEVQDGRDPKVFGVGKIDSIKKIQTTRDGLAGLKEQKEEIKKYKEELYEQMKRENYELEKYLKDRNISHQETQGIKKKIQYSNNLQKKKDLNKIAVVIKRYWSSKESNHAQELNILFNYFSNPEKYRKDLKIALYKKIAQKNLEVSLGLEKINIDTDEINSFKTKLSNSYKNIGKTIFSIIDFLESGEKYNKTTEDLFLKYGTANNDLLKVENKIAFYIETYNINFLNTDDGIIFDYQK